MRLTLRTLLAYLDDVLEPSHAREIGEKINESALATQLIARIRDVIRRRRLAAPALAGSGSGIDPNTVAEYLDNSLSPEAVVDVEKICLDSDVNLAEVAACHQVLTLVLGEAIEIPNASRDRMYGLGPVPGETASAAQPAVAALAVPIPAPVVAQPAPRSEERAPDRAAVASARHETFASTLPDYLQPAPSLWSKALPAIVVLLLLVAWGWAMVYFFNWGNIGPGRQIAGNTPPTPPPNAVPAPANQPGPNQIHPEAVNSAPNQPSEPDAAAEKTSPSPDGINPMPPADLPDEPASKPADASQPAPLPTEAASKSTTEVKITPETTTPEPPEPSKTPAETPAPAETTPIPVAVPGPVVTYQSREGVLLLLSPQDQHWFPVDRRTAIAPGSVLAVPAPFDALFQFDGGLGTVAILDGSLVRVLGPNDAADFGWSIERGRMLVRLAPGAMQKKFGLEVRGDLWGLELQGDDASIGIEVIPREPSHREEDLTGRDFFGTIYVERGKLRVVDAKKMEETVPTGGFYLLHPETPQPSGTPLWLGDVARSRITRQYAKQFEKELIGLEAGTPADQLVFDIVKDKRPLMSQYAVECLGLMAAIDQLLDALKASEHQESRVAALRAIRAWLPGKPENKDGLLLELQKRFNPEDVKVMYDLLWGFSADDLRSQQTSDQLVTWLEHDEIAVRELAFYYIVNLTRKTNDYRPNDRAPERQEAVRRWKQQLNRGPLLPPAPVAPPAETKEPATP